MNSKFLKISKYQRKIDSFYSQCLTCERKCKIAEGNTGLCQTRINIDGKIHTNVYGLIPALSFNLIEKKPLYHFYPGSVAITIGTYGCNFTCFWCQNHHLSKTKPFDASHFDTSDEFLSPERLIEIALKRGCNGTSISFNEPTLLFEYSLNIFNLAKQNGLYNTYVTNGYMTEEVLRDLVGSGLDAMNIDIKGDFDMVQKYCGIDVEKVWRNAVIAKNLGVHVEITTLLIQGINTDENIIKNIAERIKKELGENTPFHISRAFPHYKSNEYGIFEPTPIEILYKAHKIAKEEGLKHVYLGNLPKSKYNNTYCPHCSNILIKRKLMGIEKKFFDSNGNCNFCGFPICIT